MCNTYIHAYVYIRQLEIEARNWDASPYKEDMQVRVLY